MNGGSTSDKLCTRPGHTFADSGSEPEAGVDNHSAIHEQRVEQVGDIPPPPGSRVRIAVLQVQQRLEKPDDSEFWPDLAAEG